MGMETRYVHSAINNGTRFGQYQMLPFHRKIQYLCTYEYITPNIQAFYCVWM